MRALWYWSTQTVFCSAVAATCLRLFQQSGKAKRTVGKDHLLIMLQLFYSQVFQLNCCLKFSCASCGIEAHRPSFVPQLPPPTCVHFSRVAAQIERWKKDHLLMMLQFFYSPIFQLNYCFHFLNAICGFESHRQSFEPPLLPPACVQFSRVAAQKERWEIIMFWWCFSFFNSPVFQLNFCSAHLPTHQWETLRKDWLRPHPHHSSLANIILCHQIPCARWDFIWFFLFSLFPWQFNNFQLNCSPSSQLYHGNLGPQRKLGHATNTHH